MRKFIIILLVSLSSTLSLATPTVVDSCKAIDSIRVRMRVISANIANVNTTRTPEGGAYRIRHLECDNNNQCEIIESLKTLLKYEPDHPDANTDGYVAYPDLNLMQEMNALIEATRDYEEALIKCRKQ